jgi:redox-regulated HSP33 family molecular chaperone
MIYVKAVLTALSAAGLLTKLLVAAGLFAAMLTAYGVWHHKVYQSGVRDTLVAIARADAKVIARATEYRNAWKNCRALEKKWDQTTGGCS